MLINRIVKLLKDYDIQDYTMSFKNDRNAISEIQGTLNTSSIRGQLVDYIEEIANDNESLQARAYAIIKEIETQYN